MSMQVKVTQPTDTEAVITIVADDKELLSLKEHVLGHFQDKVKLAGFRSGKAPLALVEKNVDPQTLQTEFLQDAVNQLYSQALSTQKLKVIAQPEISIKKFVPFTTLDFEAKVPVLSSIKLADYQKIKKTKPQVKLMAADVDDVIVSLQQRQADKKDVDRAATNGDEVWIDFKGTDTKGQPIQGAEGENYPLQLGSNNFIPGFETNLIGLKPGTEKIFTLTFPKDYNPPALAGKKVTFKVTVTKVQEVALPSADDTFAAKAGPFQSLAELKADIKNQLQLEKQTQVDRQYESELIQEVSEKSTLTVPKMLVDDQVERTDRQVRRDLTSRGQTLSEYLTTEEQTEEQYKESLRPQAEQRVKASLVLAEIAEAEKIEVTNQEIQTQIQQLKSQYKDQAMQDELNKPENQREIANRILTEKTIHKLVGYAQK